MGTPGSGRAKRRGRGVQGGFASLAFEEPIEAIGMIDPDRPPRIAVLWGNRSRRRDRGDTPPGNIGLVDDHAVDEGADVRTIESIGFFGEDPADRCPVTIVDEIAQSEPAGGPVSSVYVISHRGIYADAKSQVQIGVAINPGAPIGGGGHPIQQNKISGQDEIPGTGTMPFQAMRLRPRIAVGFLGQEASKKVVPANQRTMGLARFLSRQSSSLCPTYRPDQMRKKICTRV